MTMASAEPPRGAATGRGQPRPGRPRDPEVDRAILHAALRVLTDRGYAGMSIERVAAAAGVGKTAIYRRYATKEELAAGALSSIRDQWGPPPDTGCARSDIVEMLARAQATFAQGAALAMLGALLVEERRNPGLFELFRERILRPQQRDALKVLRRGVARGEIRADANLQAAVLAMVGSMLARHVIGIPESRQQTEDSVDTVWHYLATEPQE